MDTDILFDSDLEIKGIKKVLLLDEQVIKAALQLYVRLLPQTEMPDFHSTMFFPNESYRKEASAGIQQILGSTLDKILPGYRVLFANFIVKEASPDTAVGIHQDWNFTTPEFPSYNVWIPLVDIDKTTGLFYALHGSHKTFTNIRYTPYPTDAYAHLEVQIREKSTPYAIPAGTALVYHGGLVHYSGPNLSGKQRLAIGCALIPKHAPNVHYYRPTQNAGYLEVYSVNETFYHSFNFNEAPKSVIKSDEIPLAQGIPLEI